MKTLLTIAIAAFAVSSPFVARAGDTEPVGRYQLLYAATESSNAITKTVTTSKTVWKIDTVTGQVWQFTSLRDKNGVLKEAFTLVESEAP